jgi:2-succinyl-5-enolpyruvyl-6-hydroxy-3-cyclohexene-1-carboxylate synthase
LPMLQYLRQLVVQAWQRSLLPTPGPVHLNLPFCDPLVPIADPDIQQLSDQFLVEEFFAAVRGQQGNRNEFAQVQALDPSFNLPWQQWFTQPRGVIIAGPTQPLQAESYCQAIAALSKQLGWPVLAEGLSPLRNYADLNPYLISTYDLLLRDMELANHLAPQQVLQIGELPTSKELRSWLQQHQPRVWVIDPAVDNFDSLHGQTVHFSLSIERVAQFLSQTTELNSAPTAQNPYLQSWLQAEAIAKELLSQSLSPLEELFEGKVAWTLCHALPPETPLFIANSTPIRDVEAFWQPSNSHVQPYFNRGANGIDGTLSTALGVTFRQRPSVLLTGDLALLHDTNGFLVCSRWVGSLTIVLINNNGGGIFANLPIANFDPPFEDFFVTPQHVNFAKLCATYGVEHELIQSWSQLTKRLQMLPESGVRVLEIPCDRQADAHWRRTHLPELAKRCSRSTLAP